MICTDRKGEGPLGFYALSIRHQVDITSCFTLCASISFSILHCYCLIPGCCSWNISFSPKVFRMCFCNTIFGPIPVPLQSRQTQYNNRSGSI